MPLSREIALAERVRSELLHLRSGGGSHAAKLTALRDLENAASPTHGTGILSTAIPAPAERSAAHVAISKLLMELERASFAHTDLLWGFAIEAAGQWCRALAAAAQRQS